MSKRMGDNYLTSQMVKYHLSTPKNSHVTTNQGYKLPMPKYYKEKIFNPEQRKAVTEYLQKRSEQKEIDYINLKKQQFPNQSEDFYLNLLKQTKDLTTFDERKNPVL